MEDADRAGRFVERSAPWVRDLWQWPGVRATGLWAHAVALEWEGLRLLVGKQPRLVAPRATSRLWLQHCSGLSFDLGDCVAELDHQTTSNEILGAQQLEIISERTFELRSLMDDPDRLVGLRDARRDWMESSLPDFGTEPTDVPIPDDHLAELDSELAAQGFSATGEGVSAGELHVRVRRRGPVAVLLASDRGSTSVAVSLWPDFGWYDLNRVQHLLADELHRAPSSFESEAVRDGVNPMLTSGMEVDWNRLAPRLLNGYENLVNHGSDPLSIAPFQTYNAMLTLWCEHRGPSQGDGRPPVRQEWHTHFEHFATGLLGTGPDIESLRAWASGPVDAPWADDPGPALRSQAGGGSPDVFCLNWLIGVPDLVMSDWARDVVEPFLDGWAWAPLEVDGERRSFARPDPLCTGDYIDRERTPIHSTKAGDLRFAGAGEPGTRVNSGRIAATRAGLMVDGSLTLVSPELKAAIEDAGLSGFRFSPVEGVQH